MRFVVAISGASGAIYGIRLLEELKKAGAESHLVISSWGRETILQETDYTVEAVEALASTVYDPKDQAAAISSGSFLIDGMAVVPCSMNTLASIAHGYAGELISRAASVNLKEQRRLVIMPRESPLNTVQLENMLTLARMGVRIMPPMPAFYNRPKTLEDVINHTVGRVLDHLGVDHKNLMRRWKEGS